MWTARRTPIEGRRALEIAIERAGAPVPAADVLGLWQRDEAFRDFFRGLLADAPFAAYKWETPAVTAQTVGRPFTCVLLESLSLDVAPDPDPFAEHFGAAAGEQVLTFANLGGDAVLVVPTPEGPPEAYPHLAVFCREAPEEQQHRLWQAVGAAMERRIGARPVWLSTAGGGVAWVHVRLDDRPKYYGYGPYRDAGDRSDAA